MTVNNSSVQKILSWSFFTAAALDLIGVGLGLQWMQIVFKPLIVVSLVLLYLASSQKRNGLYLSALAFSFLGDVFLLDKNEFFLFGVGAFLVAQLLFILLVRRNPPALSRRSMLMAAPLFLVYLVLLMRLLMPELGSMRYPVLIYGAVISVFGITALQNYLTRNDAASGILLLGALLFIASDSMIAINKFLEPHMVYPVAIMLTYVLAQYFIYQYVVATERR
jgi:uncharacterized membrane protein YhhN